MAFPNIQPTDISITSVNPTKVVQSINGIEQRAVGSGQYFVITATYSNLTAAQRKELFGFIQSQRGQLNGFLFPLPDTLGDGSGTNSTLAGGGIAEGVTLATLAANPFAKTGDLVKFGTHSKLYMVTANTSSTTLSFMPAVRETVGGGQSVSFQNLEMYVRFSTDNSEFSIGTDLFSTITLEMREVLL